jgi:non-ribosomal peptide synthetase component F
MRRRRQYPKDRCIHELFEEQVEKTPGRDRGRMYGEQSLSYAELNRQANQLAHYLIGMGVQPEEPDSDLRGAGSLGMVVGLLGDLEGRSSVCAPGSNITPRNG